MNEMKKLLSTVRQAVDHYGMIKSGDKIALGLSAGKDSAAMLIALAKMRDFYPEKYDLCAISVDLGFGNSENIFGFCTDLCSALGIPYYIEKTEIARIVFREKRETNPCALCAKLRRGALNSRAKETGFCKIALGHHLDDAVDTFMMSLMFEGRIGCFSPITEYEDNGISVIRPLVYTKEKDIRAFIKSQGITVPTSLCPENGKTEREDMKIMLREFDKHHRGLYKRVLGAMERSGVDGWQ